MTISDGQQVSALTENELDFLKESSAYAAQSIQILSADVDLDNAFQDFVNLTAIQLPSGLKEIPNFAFKGCESLCSVDIPASVSRIGDSAFEDCYSLSSVTFNGKRKLHIGNLAFRKTKIQTLDFNKRTVDVGHFAFQFCKHLKSVENVKFGKLGYGIFFQCPSLESADMLSSFDALGIKLNFYGCKWQR